MHVTLRVLPRVWNLRPQRGLRAIGDSLHPARDLFGMRLCDGSMESALRWLPVRR